MKVIVAGGRDYIATSADLKRLKETLISAGCDEVVSGAALGADRVGELMAEYLKIPCVKFPADWDLLGKAAGHARNKQMAQYADAVFLFHGGKGTASMRQLAQDFGLKFLFDQDNQEG